MKQFKNFYEGTYAKYILPGVLLQSVLIGGGYATGREIYSYGAKFGAMGWISGLTIGIGFALFAFLTFEICRIYKVYDYKNYIKQVIGPIWPMMDICPHRDSADCRYGSRNRKYFRAGRTSEYSRLRCDRSDLRTPEL